MIHLTIIGFILFSLFLTGCGGGGSDTTAPQTEVVEVNGTEILKNNEEMEDLGKVYFEGKELNAFKDKLSELKDLGVEGAELNYYTDDTGNILGIEVN